MALQWRDGEDGSWWGKAGPLEILAFLGASDEHRPTDRRLRLFACALARQVWHKLQERERYCVRCAEWFADNPGSVERNALCSALKNVWTWSESMGRAVALEDGWNAAYTASRVGLRMNGTVIACQVIQAELAHCVFGNPFLRPRSAWLGRSDCRLCLGAGRLLVTNGDSSGYKDCSECFTVNATARDIGQAAYRDQDFYRLLALADALEENGCQSEEILGHFRPGCTRCMGDQVEAFTDNIFTEHPRGIPCGRCGGLGYMTGRHARGCRLLDLVLGRMD
jgi:hypothetical protein